MELHQIETRLLSGLIHDRHLLTLAANEGFHIDLLASPQARRLAKVVVDLHEGSPAAAVDEVTLRVHLDDRGLMSPEMERYLASVLLIPPPNAGDLLSQVEILKARESRELLASVHEAIGGYLYKHDKLFDGRPVNDENVRDIIMNGTGKMIPFKEKLEPKQVDDVIAYLKTL